MEDILKKAREWAKGEMHISKTIYRFDKASNVFTYEEWLIKKYKQAKGVK